MKHFALIAMVLATFSLAACQTYNERGKSETLGGLGGAVLGGLAGSQLGSGSGKTWATGAGVLLGALIGSELGAQMDGPDRQYAATAQQRAYDSPIGEPVTWRNPESGNHGTYTPTRDGHTQSGNYCREYEQTVTIDGRQQSAYGTACQQPDGTWKIVS